MSLPERARWWILCRIVDNFGDAGVCWRLAAQLADEHGIDTSLITDRPDLLRALAGPAAERPQAPLIWPWPRELAPANDADALVNAQLPDALISAFGCDPPSALRSRLSIAAAHDLPQPVWINLEYLSAEPWIDGCHGLRSVSPADGVIQHFFYPGFSETSGGLLRRASTTTHEPADNRHAPDLLAEKQARAEAQSARVEAQPARAEALLQAHGIRTRPEERVVLLFCYPQAPVRQLLDALAASPRRTLLLALHGVAQEATDAWGAGRGSVRIERLPFVCQADFDALLDRADFNFVRGEDSWVRAHWSRAPFVWQPYRQDDGADAIKLDAFLARMRSTCPQPCEVMDAYTELTHAWCGRSELAAAWAGWEAQPAQHVTRLFDVWRTALQRQQDLATQLVRFVAKQL